MLRSKKAHKEHRGMANVPRFVPSFLASRPKYPMWEIRPHSLRKTSAEKQYKSGGMDGKPIVMWSTETVRLQQFTS